MSSWSLIRPQTLHFSPVVLLNSSVSSTLKDSEIKRCDGVRFSCQVETVVGGPSHHVVLGRQEDQRHLLVSGAQQRKHPFGELGHSVEAVDLRACLHVVKGHLSLVHVQEHAHLTQFRRTLNLQCRRKRTDSANQLTEADKTNHLNASK